MNSKIIFRFSTALFPLFFMGCEAKDKGNIVFERHKNINEFYLVNNSPSRVINFTIRMSEKTSSEKRYFGNKKSVLDSDSTNETFVFKLAPGARQYMGTTYDSDTLNLNTRGNPVTYSIDSTTLGRYPSQHQGIIITNKNRIFEIVGATFDN